MGVKISVGLQKKVGLPDFGSFCASCHVEFEVDRGLLERDLDGFHQKVSDAFVACKQAVNDQLALANESAAKTDIQDEVKPARDVQSNAGKSNGHAGSNSHPQRPVIGTVTQSQLRAIHAISRRNRMDPAVLVRERFQLDRPEYLTIRQASTIIEEFKQQQQFGAQQ
jgi:hypothetical protein